LEIDDCADHQFRSGFFSVLTRARVNQILDEQLAESDSEAVNEPVVVVPDTSLNDVVNKLSEQNRILQNSLDLQKAEADRLRALQQVEADRLKAIADAADAAAVARQQAEQTARDLAAQQAAEEARKPLYTPEQLKQKYLNYSAGGSHLLLFVRSSDLVPVWNDGSTEPSKPSGETRTAIGYTFSASFSRSGSYTEWGDARVVFNGKIVLDKNGSYCGTDCTNLDWLGHYSYQITYSSPGREDSVFEGTITPPINMVNSHLNLL